MDVTPLLNLGAIGCVLAWFMLRSEPRLKRVEESIDRFSRNILLLALALPNVSRALKEEANKALAELDEASKSR